MARPLVSRVLGQVREGLEGLLEVGHRLAERGAVEGPGAGLLAVGHGLVPHLAAEGMVGQAFHLLGHPVSSERLQGLDDLRMQSAPPFVQQAAVRHLLGQDMLEGVGRVPGRDGFRRATPALWRCARPSLQRLFWQPRDPPVTAARAPRSR